MLLDPEGKDRPSACWYFLMLCGAKHEEQNLQLSEKILPYPPRTRSLQDPDVPKPCYMSSLSTVPSHLLWLSLGWPNVMLVWQQTRFTALQ